MTTLITQKAVYCLVFEAQSRVVTQTWSQTGLADKHLTVRRNWGRGTVHFGGSWRKGVPKISYPEKVLQIGICESLKLKNIWFSSALGIPEASAIKLWSPDKKMCAKQKARCRPQDQACRSALKKPWLWVRSLWSIAGPWQWELLTLASHKHE